MKNEKESGMTIRFGSRENRQLIIGIWQKKNNSSLDSADVCQDKVNEEICDLLKVETAQIAVRLEVEDEEKVAISEATLYLPYIFFHVLFFSRNSFSCSIFSSAYL